MMSLFHLLNRFSYLWSPNKIVFLYSSSYPGYSNQEIKEIAARLIRKGGVSFTGTSFAFDYLRSELVKEDRIQEAYFYYEGREMKFSRSGRFINNELDFPDIFDIDRCLEILLDPEVMGRK